MLYSALSCNINIQPPLQKQNFSLIKRLTEKKNFFNTDNYSIIVNCYGLILFNEY